jgi:zinc protease
MTVVVSENYATPIAASVACFNVGYVDDPPETPGISKLLARIIHNGSPLGPSPIDPTALGDLIGVDVTPDSTCYHIVTDSAQIKEALSLQAEMIQNPALAPGQLERETASLAEEETWVRGGYGAVRDTSGRLLDDSPSSFSMARFLDATVLGGVAATSPRSATREDVSEFYRAHYRPEKLVIVVVGAVSAPSVLIQIQQLYAGFSVTRPSASPESVTVKPPVRTATEPPAQAKTETPAPLPPEEKPRPGEPGSRYASDRGDIAQTVATIGFRLPGFDVKDWAAAEMAAAILGQGRGSRLFRPTLDGQPVVSRVESRFVIARGTGVLALQMWVDPAGIDRAESTFFKGADRLRRELVGEDEIARATALLERRFLEQTATYLGRARALARAQTWGLAYSTPSGYRNKLRAVRAEDLQRFAARYFTGEAASVHEYEPLAAPARSFDSSRYAAAVSAWAPGLAAPVDPKQVRSPQPGSQAQTATQGRERSESDQSYIESIEPLPVKDFSTLHGPRAFVREDHSQPQVTVVLLFQGGRVTEDATNSGITELMVRSLLYGTARRTAVAVAHEMEQLGAEVEVVAGPDFFGLSASALTHNADRVVKILRDLIEEPAFRDEDLARAKTEQIGLIRDDRSSSTARSLALLLQALLPGHAYSLPTHGREEVLAKLDAQQIHSWYDRTIKRQTPLAVIVGDTDGSALVSGQLAEGFRRREVDRTIQVKVAQPAAGQEKAEETPLPSTAVAIGGPGTRPGSSERPAIELAQRLLDASCRPGRLPNGVSVACRTGHLGLMAAGIVYLQLVVSPDSEQVARAWVSAQMARLPQTTSDKEHVTRAAAAAATWNVMRLQSQKQRALEYAAAFFHQQQPAEVDALSKQFAKITPEELKQVAELYFKTSGICVGVVRGRTRTTQRPAEKK